MGLQPVKFGTTSLTMRAEVRNMISRSSILIIEQVVFVSLGPDGLPMAHGYSETTYARDRIPEPETLG